MALRSLLVCVYRDLRFVSSRAGSDELRLYERIHSPIRVAMAYFDLECSGIDLPGTVEV